MITGMPEAGPSLLEQSAKTDGDSVLPRVRALEEFAHSEKMTCVAGLM